MVKFEVGDTVYIFGRKELKGKIVKIFENDGLAMIEMRPGRWWFGGEKHRDSQDMFVSTLIGTTSNLEREGK